MITTLATAWTVLTTALMAAKVLFACLPITGFAVQSAALGREDVRTAKCAANVGTVSPFAFSGENCTLIFVSNPPSDG